MRSAAHAHRPFIDAVTRQLTRPPGAVDVMSAGQVGWEDSVRGAVLALLEGASAGIGSEPFEHAAHALRADTRLLSSVFQNLDLFDVHDVIGSRVALLVSEALSAPATPAEPGLLPPP